MSTSSTSLNGSEHGIRCRSAWRICVSFTSQSLRSTRSPRSRSCSWSSTPSKRRGAPCRTLALSVAVVFGHQKNDLEQDIYNGSRARISMASECFRCTSCGPYKYPGPLFQASLPYPSHVGSWFLSLSFWGEVRTLLTPCQSC